MKILARKLALSSGSVRQGSTVRIGYYEQTGLDTTASEEALSVLKFVQQEVAKSGGPASGSNVGVGSGASIGDDVDESAHYDVVKGAQPHIVIETGAALGRRKSLAGKQAGVSVQVRTATTAANNNAVAYSEKEAMHLLTRFQFPARRWQDKVSQLSGGERRRLQLLQVLALNPNVLLLDEPSNDLGK